MQTVWGLQGSQDDLLSWGGRQRVLRLQCAGNIVNHSSVYYKSSVIMFGESVPGMYPAPNVDTCGTITAYHNGAQAITTNGWTYSCHKMASTAAVPATDLRPHLAITILHIPQTNKKKPSPVAT